MSDRIKQIDEKMAQLKARRERELSKIKAAARASDNRRKSILGGWLLANDPAKVAEIVSQLKRDQDRRAFDLEPLPQEKKPATESADKAA